MPRKQAKTAAPVPPVVRKPPTGRAINLYLYDDDIEELDTITGKMSGTRSDAIRWLLSLARDTTKGKAK